MKTAIDLFAGAGGFSTGAKMAGIETVWAANHWKQAVDTHELNHPNALHACQDLQQANFIEVPDHDVMLASPACQGHSDAKGKEQPHHDSQRATAWAVLTAAEVHGKPFLVENVVNFVRKWKLFPIWKAGMEALGYSLSINFLDSADSGVPQHRLRVFIAGTKSKHPVVLKMPQREHVPVSNVIDFDAGKWRPIVHDRRAPATISRWQNGRKTFGERFVMPFYGSGSGLTGRDIARPIGTITTKDRWMVVDGDRGRLLTLQENREIMSFPPDYILPHNGKDALKMLGNAVCPVHARDVLLAFKEAV